MHPYVASLKTLFEQNADPAQAAAACQAVADGGGPDERDTRGACACTEGIPSLPLGIDGHAAEPAGHAHNPGAPGRRRMARCQLRPDVEHAVRQRKRGSDDQQAQGRVRRAWWR